MPRPRSRVRYSSALGQTRPSAETSVLAAPPPPVPRPASRVVPTVDLWTAGEMFVSPHAEERRRGFAILVGSETARRSPLTQHLLTSRVDEADLSLRAHIVQALADYFEVRGREYRYPPELRAAIANHLRRHDRPQVLALVEIHLRHADTLTLTPDCLARLLERIPNASAHLTRLAGDKTLSLEVRRAAIDLIGQVGFTDAVPVLEGLEARIEGRRAGQLTMLFAPPEYADDAALLPALKVTLTALNDRE